MIDSVENEIELKVKIFFKEKTFTFLKVINSENYQLYYNGYIKENNKDYIIFQDDKLGEIPIIKKNIIFIDVSNKEREND